MENKETKRDLEVSTLATKSLAADLAKSKDSKNLLGDIRKETRRINIVLKTWKLEDISKLELRLEKQEDNFSKLKEKVKGKTEDKKEKPDTGLREKDKERNKEKDKEKEKVKKERESKEERERSLEKEKQIREKQLRDKGFSPEEAKRKAAQDTKKAEAYKTPQPEPSKESGGIFSKLGETFGGLKEKFKLNPKQLEQYEKNSKFLRTGFKGLNFLDLLTGKGEADESIAGILANSKTFSKIPILGNIVGQYDALKKLGKGDVSGAVSTGVQTEIQSTIFNQLAKRAAQFIPESVMNLGKSAGTIGAGTLAAFGALAAFDTESQRKRAEETYKRRGAVEGDIPPEIRKQEELLRKKNNAAPPKMAEGGIVTKPTLAIIGEGGEKEYIVPQSKLQDFVGAKSSGGSDDSVRKPARAILGVVNNFISQFGSSSGDITRMVGGDILRMERIFGRERFVLPIFTKGEGNFDKIVSDSFKDLVKGRKVGGGLSQELYDSIGRLFVNLDKFMSDLEEAVQADLADGGISDITGPGGLTDTAGGEAIDYSNLSGGSIASVAGKIKVLFDEFKSIGYTDEGAKRVIAEIGREGSFLNQNLFGTHRDPKTGQPNTGMISWNDARRDRLLSEARKAGVLDESTGNLKPSAEALRFQARFLANELRSGYSSELNRSLRTEGASPARISELLRTNFIVYDARYAGGIDPQYGSAATKEWYLRISPGLKSSQTTPQPTAQPQQNIIGAIYGIAPKQQQQQAATSGVSEFFNLELHAHEPGGKTGLIASYIDPKTAASRSLISAYGEYPRNWRGGDLGAPSRGLNIIETTLQQGVEYNAQKLLKIIRDNPNTFFNVYAGHNDIPLDSGGETGTAGERDYTRKLAERLVQLTRSAGLKNFRYNPSVIAPKGTDPMANWNRAQSQKRQFMSGRQSTAPQSGISQGQTQTISPSSLPPLPPTNTASNQYYGAPRDNGARKHAGVDFDISGNQKFYSRIGGVVVGNPFAYGEDGLAIDIYNSRLGVYERIAEARRVLVRPNQIVSPGQAVVEGESRTGVIHYEIRKNIYGGYENTVNPLNFLRSIGSLSFSPSDMSQPGDAGNVTGATAATPTRRQRMTNVLSFITNRASAVRQSLRTPQVTYGSPRLWQNNRMIPMTKRDTNPPPGPSPAAQNQNIVAVQPVVTQAPAPKQQNSLQSAFNVLNIKTPVYVTIGNTPIVQSTTPF